MRKKILVVDDNIELLELLCLAIKSAGFAVSSATDGLEALARARALHPDLVVLDLVLPEMDGFAVCEVLRREPELSKVPIILLTGLTGEFTRFAGFESGASEYVQKPVNPSDLVSMIRRYLSNASRSEGKAVREKETLQLRSEASGAAQSNTLLNPGKKARSKNFFP